MYSAVIWRKRFSLTETAGFSAWCGLDIEDLRIWDKYINLDAHYVEK
jgi:hypothetical protein